LIISSEKFAGARDRVLCLATRPRVEGGWIMVAPKAVKSVRLWEHRDGRAHYLLSGSLMDDGDLQLHGSDVGPFVEDTWGANEYEYAISVKADRLGDVILGLLKDRFNEGGDWSGGKTSEFMAWLKTRGIPYGFGSWM
jgi:hypothetical protein